MHRYCQSFTFCALLYCCHFFCWPCGESYHIFPFMMCFRTGCLRRFYPSEFVMLTSIFCRHTHLHVIAITSPSKFADRGRGARWWGSFSRHPQYENGQTQHEQRNAGPNRNSYDNSGSYAHHITIKIGTKIASHATAPRPIAAYQLRRRAGLLVIGLGLCIGGGP